MSKRILVIEDDPVVLRTIEIVLLDAGYECITAPDGDAGLQLFRSKPSDLVITDLIMPRKEGIETIVAMRQEQPNAKIIAISGGGRVKNTELLRLAKGLGANEVLAKPFDPEDLVAAITRCLSADGPR
jgi:DNA-binding response OmpR family regulator